METRVRNAELQRQKDEWRQKKKEDEEKLAAEHKAYKEQIKINIAAKQSETFLHKQLKGKDVKEEKEVWIE